MRIELRGRNVAVDDVLRRHAERRFERVAKQVSRMAVLEIELHEERNPAIREACVASANLYLKGITLHARDGSEDFVRTLNLVADELARQVKRHRDKRRGRRRSEVAPRPAAP